MEKQELKPLQLCGVLGIVSFLSYLAAVVFSPLAFPGYDWMAQAVSDLSAVTAPSLSLWNRLSCLYGKCGLVSVTAVCVYTAIRGTGTRVFRSGIYLFALMNWISAVGYDLFPLSQAGTGMTTFSDIMHVYVVTAAVVLTSVVSLLLIGIGGRKQPATRVISFWALIALCMMFAGAIGTNAVPARYFGIAERFSVFSATGYNALLGWWLLRGKV